jgi:hypothetical protein
VLITVRGHVKARLTRAAPKPEKMGETWAGELRALHRSTGALPKPLLAVERILAEDREDRFVVECLGNAGYSLQL